MKHQFMTTDDGPLPGGRRFVAPPGSVSSYTKHPERAQQFPSREAALAHACGNEAPVDLWTY